MTMTIEGYGQYSPFGGIVSMADCVVAGYTYHAERRCRDCMRAIARAELIALGFNTESWAEMATESMLTTWASLIDYDRQYADSDEFPVPFSYTVAEHEAEWAAHDGDSHPRCDTDRKSVV